ncbi:permease prefix domain 1-containing protein [Butyrivibrio sp. AE2005]|uniref:permease prefix domain 1-containing protein n=1 Tax=Butyrivibrio sp. AE2005 TaxID=1496722 RepID=UPI00047C5E92|nr:permease prefix domain 1-containing protein [Butyrivibrio sp. AE2005]
MEEYIKKLLEQVRFEKAHKSIADELRAHIEDQIEVNISDGMEKEAAEKKAVEDMGDPVETGIALDKVHRPQMAWGVVIVAFFVAIVGTLIHVLMAKDPALEYLKYRNDIGSFIMLTVSGISVMLLLYLLDYITVAKYSKVVATCMIAVYMLGIFLRDKVYFMQLEWLDKTGYRTGWENADFPLPIKVLDSTSSFMNPPMLLLIPLYAGIIYKYKGQKYDGLIKSVLWLIIPSYIVSYRHNYVICLIFVLSMLVQLTFAIKKEWLKVSKIPVLITLWTTFSVFLGFVAKKEYERASGTVLRWVGEDGNLYERPTINANIDIVRAYMKQVKLFGNALLSSLGGKSYSPAQYSISDSGTSMILTYILTTGGLIVGIVVIATVVGLIVYGLVTVLKTKNQLGMVIGIGCMMWLISNTVVNILVGTGIIDDQGGGAFLPFVSNDKLVESYALLGILLSIYKYKNAYSQHIDINLRIDFKKLRLKKLK